MTKLLNNLFLILNCLRLFSITYFILLIYQEENLLDVIQLLLSVMCEKPAAIVNCFDQMEGFQ